MRIAIFGGSFDPIHIGHVEIVKKALEILDIDYIYIVPSFLNPLKKSSLFSPQKRLFFAKKVFEKFDKVKILDYEINRGEPTYTIDTVLYLKNLLNFSKCYLLIGADNYKILDKWKDVDKLKLFCEFVIIERDGIKVPNDIKKIEFNSKVSSSLFRNSLDFTLIPKEIRELVAKLLRYNSF